jgi:hypothetical protein
VLHLPTACGAEFAAAEAEQSKISTPLYGGNASLGKISSNLLEFRQPARRRVSAGQALQQIEIAPLLPGHDGLLDIEVRFRALTPDIAARVQATGMQVTDIQYRFARIYGLCDPQLLDEIAAIPEVTTVHPNYRPQRNSGSVYDQADASVNADLARLSFGVDGSGIGVGVLSDSFNDTLGGSVSGTGCSAVLTGSSPQLSGDLPATVVLLDNGPEDEIGLDEGAALAELVHDLAPGASVLFHSATRSPASMAEGIGKLRDCGADVILDDIGYFSEPMFQDGIIAQAAQAAVNSGVSYFSAAGNQATFGVDEFYRDANPAIDTTTPSGDDFHDFGGGDRFATITIPPGCGVGLVMQWNEPFDGTLGPGASSDLDLYLCTEQSASACIFSSSSIQGCGFGAGVSAGDPLEVVGVVNTGAVAAPIHVAVEHYCGSEAVRFRIAAFALEPGCNLPGTYVFESAIFNKSPIYGHPAAAGVAAVAAAFYGEIDTGGNVTLPYGVINVEPFSALGGNLPFYFDGSGSPLPNAPQLRFKPQIVAPDGSNTSFFSSDIDYDPDSYPNFLGTSAAVGHAGAVAALLLDRNNDLTPARLVDLLTDTATDIETAGVDTRSGAGLVDAFAAVSAASRFKSDIVIDFGVIGLWARMNDASWLKLSNSSPDQVVVGDVDGNGEDDVIADFASTLGGIFIKRNLGGWTQLHNFNAELMAVGDLDNSGRDDVVIDFGGIGLWARMNDATWLKLSNSSPDQVVVGDIDGNGQDDVIADFGPSLGGIFVKRNLGGWTQLHNFVPELMAVGDLDGNGKDDVVIDFGGIGLWARMNDASWLKLHNSSPELIATGDVDGNGADDVLATFSGLGFWQKLNLGGWTALSNSAPDQVVTGDVNASGKDDIIADFGSTLGGIFVKRDQGAWVKLHNSSPDSLATGNLDSR